MTNPQPDRLKPPPRRAEPLQPDKPGSGSEQVEQTSEDAEQLSRESARKQKQQSDIALDNAKNGYD